MKLEDRVSRKLATMADASGLPDYKICNIAGVGHAQLSKIRKNPRFLDPVFLLKMRPVLKCKYVDFFMLGNRMLPNLPVKDLYLKRIKEQRTGRSITEQQAAQAIGVRVTTYTTFEKHGSMLLPDKFEKLLDYLEIKPEYLAPPKTRKPTQPEEPVVTDPVEELDRYVKEMHPVFKDPQQDLFSESDRIDDLERRVNLLEGFIKATFKTYGMIEKAVSENG